MYDYNSYLESSNYIRSKFDTEGAIGIILGSGLGNMADEIRDVTVIPYKDIPNFPVTTVPGHEGSLYCGWLEGKKVVCMKGRFHFYEGHDMKTVSMPIRVMKLCGIESVIVTNAAGGCNTSFVPGTLMVIDDFINFMGDNPLRGINSEEFGPRFPDMTKAMCKEYIDMALEAGREIGIDIKHGVYMSFRGPSFETPAEIRFAQTIGADAVGMSTVPELIVARHCGMKTLGISCITNMAAGITGEELTHEEVQETADRVNKEFRQLIKLCVQRI